MLSGPDALFDLIFRRALNVVCILIINSSGSSPSTANTSLLVVIMWLSSAPKSVRLKDRDYDVTAHIFLILSLTCTPKSVMGR